jgi:rhamnogalacturonan endolyase
MVVDDNGQGLYSTRLRHGDAMYVTDMYPDRPGQEVFTVHENEENAEKFQTPGAVMRDARTGEILWSHSPTVDVGGGMAGDIDPRQPGFEAWGGPGGLRNAKGESVGDAPRETGWTIWWDGDPLREFLSLGRGGGRRGRAQPTRITKWNWETGRADSIAELDGVSFSRGPCIMGDLIGDWREEVLVASPEGNALRLYTTTTPTEIRLRTLLHDSQYRLGLAWQNVVYNKPCYPSFYVGEGMTPPPRTEIAVAGGEAAR